MPYIRLGIEGISSGTESLFLPQGIKCFRKEHTHAHAHTHRYTHRVNNAFPPSSANTISHSPRGSTCRSPPVSCFLRVPKETDLPTPIPAHIPVTARPWSCDDLRFTSKVRVVSVYSSVCPSHSAQHSTLRASALTQQELYPCPFHLSLEQVRGLWLSGRGGRENPIPY